MILKNRWYVAGLSEQLTAKPLGRTLLSEPVVSPRVLAPYLASDRMRVAI